MTVGKLFPPAPAFGGVDRACCRVLDRDRHADRPVAAVSTDPVDRHDRLVQASVARAHRRRDVGMVVIWLGVAIFLVPCLVVFVVWRTGLVKSDLTGLVFFPVFVFSSAVVAQGRRMRVAGGERVLAEDERAPIVYLRPFDADERRSRRRGRRASAPRLGSAT